MALVCERKGLTVSDVPKRVLQGCHAVQGTGSRRRRNKRGASSAQFARPSAQPQHSPSVQSQHIVTAHRHSTPSHHTITAALPAGFRQTRTPCRGRQARSPPIGAQRCLKTGARPPPRDTVNRAHQTIAHTNQHPISSSTKQRIAHVACEVVCVELIITRELIKK